MSADAQFAFDFAPPPARELSHVMGCVLRWAPGVKREELSPAELRVLDKQATPADDDRTPVGATPEGADPFGGLLWQLRTVEERRDLGQFLTPLPLVDVMVNWVRERQPAVVVDVGCGTGRFAVAAARALPEARVIAVDVDPVASLLCRAQVSNLGLTNVEVQCADFLRAPLDLGSGRAAFLGNPPYVRHHRLPPDVKEWGRRAARELGLPPSGLTGLHVYFFLATALRARPGDVGCYLTSAEWLDVGYGAGLRQLLKNKLHVVSVSLLDESCAAFEDAMTSAAITCFEVGNPSRRVRLSVVREFRSAEGPPEARHASYDELNTRWTAALHGRKASAPRSETVRLGDLVSVHRGIATGANAFFVRPRVEAEALGLARFTQPTITAAKQILESDGCIRTADCQVLVLLPKRLAGLPERERRAVQSFLAAGEAQGIPHRYLCRHREPWWWLGQPTPAPVVATYMARRPPAFALNPEGALILNIAHGLYPRRPLRENQLRDLVERLNASAAEFVGNGRRYQGGLEKFEPREMEELVLPAWEGVTA